MAMVRVKDIMNILDEGRMILKAVSKGVSEEGSRKGMSERERREECI